MVKARTPEVSMNTEDNHPDGQRRGKKDPTPLYPCILLHPWSDWSPVRSPSTSLRTKGTLPSKTSVGAVRGNTGPVAEKMRWERCKTQSGDSTSSCCSCQGEKWRRRDLEPHSAAGNRDPSGFSEKSAVVADSKTVLRNPGRSTLYSKPSEKPKLHNTDHKSSLCFFPPSLSFPASQKKKKMPRFHPQSIHQCWKFLVTKEATELTVRILIFSFKASVNKKKKSIWE